jgi:superoxide dismutase, Fe-Mn family
MEYKLPPLPYSYDALEPHIDAKTMEIHYTKHHQAYVNNLNEALKKHPEFTPPASVDELVAELGQVPSDIRIAVRNNAGGDSNHSFFWPLMKKHGGGNPRDRVDQEIKKTFGNIETFKEQFNVAAKTVFGSGWAWLSLDHTGKLLIHITPNQDSPLSEKLKPILGLDVWEHAYYLKYQNRRPDYITAWWQVINWNQVEENYLEAKK